VTKRPPQAIPKKGSNRPSVTPKERAPTELPFVLRGIEDKRKKTNLDPNGHVHRINVRIESSKGGKCAIGHHASLREDGSATKERHNVNGEANERNL